jgi:hypothetical protein
MAAHRARKLERGISAGEANLNEKVLLVGWATPAARDWRAPNLRTYAERGGGAKGEQLPNQVAFALAPWPTPDAQAMNDGADLGRHMARLADLKANGINGNGAGLTLGVAVQFAGWPTPMAGTPATETYNAAGNTDSSRMTEALLAPWATPTAGDAKAAGSRNTSTSKAHAGTSLTDQVMGDLGQGRGPTPSGSPAPTASSGPYRLNPRFSLWLQLERFAIAWASSGERATRSSRRSPPNSSARGAK